MKEALPAHMLQAARVLRKNMTEAEQLLWWFLRDKRLVNFKFRRQHPFGPYILDFFCQSARLAVELDGGQHNWEEQRAADAERTRWLNRQGITVVRFWNHEVLNDPEAVLESVWAALQEKNPHPNPLPGGEGVKNEE